MVSWVDCWNDVEARGALLELLGQAKRFSDCKEAKVFSK